MTSILNKLRTLFRGDKDGPEKSNDPVETRSTPSAGSAASSGHVAEAPEPVLTARTPEPVQTARAPIPRPAPPAMRTVIQAPLMADDIRPPDSEEILIRAQPTSAGDQCIFHVNRPLFPGHSWFFGNFESAEGSPLAEAVFVNDQVETLLVHENSLTVTRFNKNNFEWHDFAKEIGALVRKLLQEGGPLIDQRILDNMPEQEKIREGIQEVIDKEVNPGVAGHGGQVTLTRVRGNTVTITMGGGCQGCSSADVTLKMGIHGAFRKAVPMVGAIFDETDHAAGLNPYYS